MITALRRGFALFLLPCCFAVARGENLSPWRALEPGRANWKPEDPGTSDWQQLRLTANLPQRAAIRVILEGGTKGTAWFDDVEVTYPR